MAVLVQWCMDGMVDRRYRYGPVEIVVAPPPCSADGGPSAPMSSSLYPLMGVYPSQYPPATIPLAPLPNGMHQAPGHSAGPLRGSARPQMGDSMCRSSADSKGKKPAAGPCMTLLSPVTEEPGEMDTRWLYSPRPLRKFEAPEFL